MEVKVLRLRVCIVVEPQSHEVYSCFNKNHKVTKNTKVSFGKDKGLLPLSLRGKRNFYVIVDIEP